MNKKILLASLGLAMVATTFMQSCSDDDNPPPAKSGSFSYDGLYAGYQSVNGTVIELPDFTHWHYFAFDENEGVIVKGVSDFELSSPNSTTHIGTEVINQRWRKDTTWHIAFHAYDIRTNSGAAGLGSGGAVLVADATFSTIALEQMYANIKKATDANVEVEPDAVVTGVFYQNLAQDPPYQATELSLAKLVLNGTSKSFCSFTKMGSQYQTAVNPMVLILKTTNGKYIKIHLKKFVNSQDEPGHLVFDYTFIPEK
ncbi:hypothetical protein AGMMS49982_19110 [Bacteroidia bacterium]|nr:hypothetical protein AGMMS49982_19110 [Bacteroidia bacterium]